VAVALVTKVLVDLLLIPFYSYVGAAVATLVAEAMLFLAGLLMLRQFRVGLSSLRLLWRPSLGGLAMAVICWLIKDLELRFLSLGFLASGVAYAGLLLTLQAFTRQELTLVRDAMRVRVGSAVR
jgi:peptidoglycan biosynthesis protein MviN/MurJ (putative lipid II flippase)